MDRIKSWIKENYKYSSPFLFALYSVLFLFQKNQKEYRPEVLFTPLLVSLLSTLVIYVACKLILRKTEIASLVASIIVFVSLSYGRFLEFTSEPTIYLGSIKTSTETVTAVIVSLIVLIFFALILKFRKNLTRINSFVFALSLILLIIPFFNAVLFELKSGRIWNPPVNPEKVLLRKPANEVPGIENFPDIYYFIFDRYAGERSLKEQYGFDNSKFISFLKQKGFYVAENSTTNYPKTFLSLGSSLNMKYLDFLTDETNGGESSDESIVTPLIRNNDVLRFLRNKGYYYIHVGSWWEPTKKNPNSTFQFAPRFRQYWGADEFTTGFYDTTIASSILRQIFKEPSDVSKDPSNNSHRQAALQQFEEIPNIPSMKSPKFVFVHILLPHDPFVFDGNCNPISEKEVNKNPAQINYVNQLQCTNKHIEEIVSTIVTKSKKPPVVILQSDEGPYPMNVEIPPKQGWGSAETTSLREKFPIINAYLFPGKSTSALYQSITPVNSFRVLFNTYFGEHLPLLPDRNYVFQDDNNYYKFTDVTSKVKY